MKRLVFFCTALLFITLLTGCEREFEFDNEELMENSELQTRLFSLIITHEELLNDFMLELAQRPEAMRQMMMNQTMMQQMFSEENMEMLQESEPITMQMMMDHMQQAMGEEGMMHGEMMEN